MSFDERLTELGIQLPEAVQPRGSYRTYVTAGSLLFLAGHLPIHQGEVAYVGKVGAELSLEDGQSAARLTALSCLATMRSALGSLDRVQQIVRVVGYVQSAPGFTQQAAVLNGASDLFREVFGDAGIHVRTAVGVAELPSNAAIEIDITVDVS